MAEASETPKPDELRAIEESFGNLAPKLKAFFHRRDTDEELSPEEEWALTSLSGVTDNKFWF